MGTKVPIARSSGDMLLVADESILVNGFESIVSTPMELTPGEKGVFFLVTFKGVLNKEGTLKAVTMIALPELVINLVKTVRSQYAQVPIEYR